MSGYSGTPVSGARHGALFLLADGERPTRPEQVRQVTFEDEWAERSAALAGHVVPLELVRAGDEQVGVFTRLRRAERTGPAELDRLADVPTVESVVGLGTVIARTPLPHVRELYASATDEETLANLPNLRRLRIGSGLDRRPLDPEAVPAGVVDLICGGRTLGGSVTGVAGLTGLERLRMRSVETDSAEPLGGLTRLRWLAVMAGKGFAALADLVALEDLRLEVAGSLASLKRFGGWSGLRRLHLDGRGLKSLAGAEAFGALESVFLYRTGVRDLAPLAGLPALSTVRLDHPHPDIDLAALGALPELRELRIDMLTISSTGSLPSLRFLRGARSLERLVLQGVEIADADLSPLHELDRLRVVDLFGSYGGQVDDLRASLPAARIASVSPVAEDGPAAAVGPIRYRRLDTGRWSIFQDVSDLLGTRSNIEADGAVRGALRDEDPALLERLELDSEPDALAITAEREDDIRRAAEIVAALASG